MCTMDLSLISNNKDNELRKTIFSQENELHRECRIEHIIIKAENYNETSENKGYTNEIKEEIDVSELKCIDINTEVDTESTVVMATSMAIQYKEVKKEETTTKSKIYTPTCRMCAERFSKDEELNEHYRCNESHKPKKYMCIYCNLSFNYLTELRDHRRDTHSEKCPNRPTLLKSFICEFCERAFLYLAGLEKHMTSHNMEKRFLCEQCGKAFTAKRTLDRHTYLGHELKAGEIPEKFITKISFECSICKQIYKSRKGFSLHILKHKEEYNFLCNFCGQKFLAKTSLETHIRLHTGEKPYECPFCAKYFTRKGALKIHKCIRLRDNNTLKTQIRKFTCDYCSREFDKKQTLKRHYHECISLNAIPVSNLKEEMFICGYCAKKYSRKCNLSSHLRSHKITKYV